MAVKNEEGSIKNKGPGVLKTLYIDFSAAEEQIIPQSVVGSGRNLNTSKLL